MFSEKKMKTILEWRYIKGFDIGMRTNVDGMGEIIAYKSADIRVLVVDKPAVAAQYMRSTN